MLPIGLKKIKQKMTAKDRVVIYKDALLRIKSGCNLFMCNAIEGAFKDYYSYRYDIKHKNIIKLFPEFAENKPKETYSNIFWFAISDQKSRIKLLNKAIKDTQKIINS